MTAPAAGAVTNLSTLWAVASDANGVAGVQFLLDDSPLGSEVTTTPYTIIWDTRTASAGSHTVAARARNVSGLTTTSAPVTVTVDNSGNPAVVGSWSSAVNIPAVAVNLVLLKNLKCCFTRMDQPQPSGTIPMVSLHSGTDHSRSFLFRSRASC